MKVRKALISSLMFFLLLMFVYVLHINFIRVNVVFYSAILDVIVAVTLAVSVLLLTRYFDVFNLFEKLQLIIIWLLTGYAIAISVPTVLDRSLSFYILEKLQQRGGGIKLSQFEYVFSREYMEEHRLIDVRLTEQEKSGTIVIRNGCVMLTQWGEDLVRVSRYFRKNLLPKQRLIMGEYTDVLTDPFRNSHANPGYECKE